jgi:rod shape determining protein RodA
MGRSNRYTDSATIIALLLLSSSGLFILLTVNRALFWQQLFYALSAGVCFFFLSRIDRIIYVWSAPFVYIASIFFLLSSYLGPEIRGATRWIIVGPIQIQPSELVKPLLLLSFALFIAVYPPKKLTTILIHLGIFFLPLILVLKQPDLGTGIVYTVSWITMMTMGGLPLSIVGITPVIFITILPLMWRLLIPYQKSRLLTFINPMLDPQGVGYNAIQAMIAVGSGQWFGRGLGLGTQSHLRFLPEYYTDFIFATLVEELGFIGGAVLLILYGFLLWRIMSPLLSGQITERVPVIFSIGLFSMLLTQIVINSGMNMGMIPVTGITLPLVSYGGSSLLSVAVSFAILWAIALGK